MFFLPSRGRPKGVQRLIDAYVRTGADVPVLVILDEDDAAKYDHICPPPQWSVHVAPHKPMLYRIAEAYEITKGEPFYGLLGDDALPLTPYWDRILVESAGDWNVAYSWDGINNERLCGHMVIGGKLVDTVGYFSPPGLKHLYVDNVWMEIGRALGCLRYHDDVRIEHLHFSNGKSEWDDTYMLHGQYAGEDQELFELWRYHGELDDTVQRVRAAQIRENVEGRRLSD